MSNIIRRRIPYLCGILPFSFADIVEKTNITSKSFLLEKDAEETGQQRLYMMFSVDEYGSTSPELNAVIQSTVIGGAVGALYGGFIRSRTAYMNFMERNDATKFTSHFEAKKKLQNAVTVSFAKGAFQWGWRLALFSGSYVLITTAISVYRGKSSLIEYVTAGFLTGALYKVNMGFRGIVVGSIVGFAFGGFAGCMSLATLRITGMSMEEIRYWQYTWKLDREKHIRSSFKQHGLKNESELLKLHDQKLQEKEAMAK